MSFFRRDEEPDTAPARRPASTAQPGAGGDRPVTRIAGGTRITGEISGTTQLQIDGEVDGRIRLDGRVVVGETGGVLGEIMARTVVIAGRVEGPVRGSERVEVGGTGHLEGDIAAPRVTIAEGAFFKGQVEMRGHDERRPQRRAPAQARGKERSEEPEESRTLFSDEGGHDETPARAAGSSTGSGGRAGSVAPDPSGSPPERGATGAGGPDGGKAETEKGPTERGPGSGGGGRGGGA